MTRDEIEEARTFLKTYFPNNSSDRAAFNTICDMAVKSLKSVSPEDGALAALELAKAWIEESEDQTMEEAIRIEGRFQERGSIGYNQQYIAMCKSVLQALSQPQIEGNS